MGMLRNGDLDLDLHLSAPVLPAVAPAETRHASRDAVRLLVLNRHTGQVTYTQFANLPDFLNPGDLLVVNTSAAISAKLQAIYQGEFLQIHLSTRLSASQWLIERRHQDGGPDERLFAIGDTVTLLDPDTNDTQATLTILQHFHPESRLWVVGTNTNLYETAARIGQPIRYSYVPEFQPLSAYQSIFSHHSGSAEMPSAARPFTHSLLKRLAAKGVFVRSLILHTGVSSHEVKSSLASHPWVPEWVHIPAQTAHAVERARAKGQRIVAVGTTVVRALESAAARSGTVQAGSHWTTHLVTPDHPLTVTTSLVTGLHESQSSHLAMLYAFVHPDWIQQAYEEAIQRAYLWHEFGDSNLIL